MENEPDVLLRWLHELGELLYFSDSKDLSDLVMLDPQWVTRRVGEVLASQEVLDAKGILTNDCIKRLWPDIDEQVCRHLLGMMDRFDLAYRIPDDPEYRSLVVERLPQNPAPFEARWLTFAGEREVRLRFKLRSMHPGIPTWFIARQHRFTLGLHWLRGVLFGDERQNPKHLALVVANDAERVVDFTVRGPLPFRLMTLLVDGFLSTLSEKYPGLEADRWVPCPGKRKDGTACDNEFAMRDLEDLLSPQDSEEEPDETYKCPRCRTVHFIDQLLLGISSTPKRMDVMFKKLEDVVTQEGQKTRYHFDFVMGEALRTLQLEFVREWNIAQQLEEVSCPTVFSLFPVGNKTLLHEQELRLQLYCMAPDCWHSIQEDGACQFRPLIQSLVGALGVLRSAAKWIRPAAKILHPAIGTMGDAVHTLSGWAEAAKSEFELLEKMTDELSKIEGGIDTTGRESVGGVLPRSHDNVSSLQNLKSFLDGLKFPMRPYGGLQRIRTRENHILWLCPQHAEQYRW